MNSEQAGRKIKELRIKAQLTQEELAAKAKVNRLSVLRLEKGIIASPTLEDTILIGRALGLDANEIAQIYEI